MSEVHRFSIARAKNPFDPNEKLVKFIEGLLEQAKEGKLRGIAVATVYHDDLDPGGEASEGWNYSPGTKFSVSHALFRLNATWASHLLKEETP